VTRSTTVDFTFGDDAQRQRRHPGVHSLVPIARRCHARGGICTHSPPAASMGRFDTPSCGDITDDDYAPHTGSLHLMTWGRGCDAEGLEESQNAGAYLSSGTKAGGREVRPPNAIGGDRPWDVPAD
jgi:hypothetical protein